ncbi:MAG: hypothetical protein MI723_19500 [Caulobacterales bacterium]|nr:hypothetical protein [Caulobacterales bacterium]
MIIRTVLMPGVWRALKSAWTPPHDGMGNADIEPARATMAEAARDDL